MTDSRPQVHFRANGAFVAMEITRTSPSGHERELSIPFSVDEAKSLLMCAKAEYSLAAAIADAHRATAEREYVNQLADRAIEKLKQEPKQESWRDREPLF